MGIVDNIMNGIADDNLGKNIAEALDDITDRVAEGLDNITDSISESLAKDRPASPAAAAAPSSQPAQPYEPDEYTKQMMAAMQDTSRMLHETATQTAADLPDTKDVFSSLQANMSAITQANAPAKGAPRPVKKIADNIFDLGTYTELDYEYTLAKIASNYDSLGIQGGCTCVVKTLADGQTIAGRNMDLTISNNAAFVIRTNCPDKYQTLGLSYTYVSGPSSEQVEADGSVPDDFAKFIPFISTDVINSEGLYIETNMRSGEYCEDGSLKFACTGTNPAADMRTCTITIPRLLGENCATVDEAVAFAKEKLDLYTPTKGLPWNFCFMLADKSGHRGLLEIACNKVSWIDDQFGQANFYITPEFAEIQELKCGIGRYQVISEGLADVQSEEQMFDLMSKVTYFQIYKPNPQYDVRTEYVDIKPGWTCDYVLAEENRAEIEAYIANEIDVVGKMSRQELKDACKYWESVFSVVANCGKKTLTVLFFEDDQRAYRFTV